MSKKIKITGMADSFAESLQNCLGEMLILFLLKQKPMYIYEISQELNRISDGSFTYKSLYPYIYRLKNAECIAEQSKEVAKNRTRIYFHITEYGLTHLVNLKRKYRDYLAQFIQENDSVELADIISYLNSPQELAPAYLDCIPEKDMTTCKFKRKRYNILLGSISIIVIVTIALLSVKVNEFRKMDSIYIHQSTEILEKSTK